MPNSNETFEQPTNIPEFRGKLDFDPKIFAQMMDELENATTLEGAASAIDEIFIMNTFTEIL